MDNDYEIRDLELNDYEHGFINILSQLTETGDITKEDFAERFKLMKTHNTYFIKVIIDNTNKKIVGAGTLVLEYKFIHGCSMKGHIEDIVVDESLQRNGFGKTMLVELIEPSQKLGCYKTALCCKDELVKFYEKCGAERKGTEMVIYHNK